MKTVVCSPAMVACLLLASLAGCSGFETKGARGVEASAGLVPLKEVHRFFEVSVSGFRAPAPLGNRTIDAANNNCIGLDDVNQFGLHRIRADASLAGGIRQSNEWVLAVWAVLHSVKQESRGIPPLHLDFDFRNSTLAAEEADPVRVVVFVFPASEPVAMAVQQRMGLNVTLEVVHPQNVTWPDQLGSCA